MTHKIRRFRPSPALVVAFIALFAAMGGFGYAAVKMKPNSVRSKNIKDGAITTNKIAEGAVTTTKLSPDAVAPNAVNAMNAAQLGGVAPGHCQLGWLKAAVVIDTSALNDANPDMDVAGFDCASSAMNAFHVHRLELDFAAPTASRVIAVDALVLLVVVSFVWGPASA